MVAQVMIVMPRTLDMARLHLRPLASDDASAVFAYASDPAVARYMVWPAAETVDDSRAFIEDTIGGWDDGDDYCYGVIERDSQCLMGAVSCQFSVHGAEFGYVLARHYWGRGYASEAAGALLAAAEKIDDVYRFWATCDVDNPASAHVLEKIGMSYEARLARWSPSPNLEPDGAPRDVCVYALTR